MPESTTFLCVKNNSSRLLTQGLKKGWWYFLVCPPNSWGLDAFLTVPLQIAILPTHDHPSMDPLVFSLGIHCAHFHTCKWGRPCTYCCKINDDVCSFHPVRPTIGSDTSTRMQLGRKYCRHLHDTIGKHTCDCSWLRFNSATNVSTNM